MAHAEIRSIAGKLARPVHSAGMSAAVRRASSGSPGRYATGLVRAAATLRGVEFLMQQMAERRSRSIEAISELAGEAGGA